GTKVLIRVDADSGIDQQTIEASNYVRGVGTQFDPSSPFTSGYQILALELQHVTAIPVLDKNAILMTPNPADYSVTFKSDYNLSGIEIYSMDGKSILNEKVDGTSAEISVANMPIGLFIVKAITKQGIWTSLLSVIR
ncbi:MAG: T9SS type A sorting domain-containing protein, partial [Saprospiraceae bacterium]